MTGKVALILAGAITAIFGAVSDTVWLSIIGGIVTTCATVSTLLQVMMNYRLKKQELAIEAIHRATNSMKDALVASTAKASHAEGLAEGKGQARADQKKEDKKKHL